jgi:hypothetical protein
MYLFLLIPLFGIRFGFTWWISIATLGLIFGVMLFPRLFELKTIYPFVISGILALPMFSATLLDSDASQKDLLRTSREFFCILLILILFNSKIKSIALDSKSLIKVLRVFLYSTLILTIVQYFLFKRGVYLGPTEGAFGGRGAIVPKALDLKYSKLRPSSLYAEPSYLAFVILIVLIILAMLILNNEKVGDLYIVAGLILIVSQSRSGLVFLVLVSAFLFLDKRTRQNMRKGRLTDFSLVLLSLVILSQVLPNYLLSDSFRVRVLYPFEEVTNALNSNLLGVPFYSRINGTTEILNLPWTKILDNSFYSLVFSYGLTGICIILVTLLSARKDKYLFVMVTAAFLQNGSVFDFDKVVLLLLGYSITSILKQDRL